MTLDIPAELASAMAETMTKRRNSRWKNPAASANDQFVTVTASVDADDNTHSQSGRCTGQAAMANAKQIAAPAKAKAQVMTRASATRVRHW